MNTLTRTISLLTLCLLSNSAFAVLVTSENNPFVYLQSGESHTVTHDLAFYGVPAPNQVTSANLSLGFSDGDFAGDLEQDLALVSGAGISGIFEVNGTHMFGYDIQVLGVGEDGLSSLNSNGQLQVTVLALDSLSPSDLNDFWWKTSILTANVEVPEPATVSLMLLGLLGLVVARRSSSVI